MFTVKVGKVPGTTQEVTLDGDRSSVGAALQAAGLSAAGYSITVNGEAANVETCIRDGNRVLLSKAVKGNQ